MVLVLGLLCGGVGVMVLLLGAVARDPATAALFAHNLDVAGLSSAGLGEASRIVEVALQALRFLLVAQLLGTTAVMAGQSVLHDRQVGTLPFLLLAPLRRGELLAGKVLGSLGLPLLLYVAFGGACAVSLGTLSTPALLVSFFLSTPLWAAWLATVGALISFVSRDVRTAQQAVWAVVLVVTGTVGLGLGADSVQIQVAMTALGGLALGATLGLGALLLGRDLGRG